MLILALILSAFGVGFLCWLVFELAVYALPSFAGATAGFAALHSGAGVIGGIAVGLLAGAATLGAGQFAFSAIRSQFIRTLIALLFAVPAAIAGYHATLGLAEFGVPSESWRQTFAITGALLVGGAAWMRIAQLDPPVAPRSSSGSAALIDAANDRG